MKSKLLAFCLLLPFFTSCSHYLYQGKIASEGVDGREHEHIIFWNTTEYAFGIFDKATDITLKTCGKGESYTFKDDSGKIIFQGDPSKMARLKKVRTKGDICGAIIGHDIIDLIPEGRLKVGVYCNPQFRKKAVSKPKALKAQRKLYVFPIKKTKSKDIALCEDEREELEALKKKEAMKMKKKQKKGAQ